MKKKIRLGVNIDHVATLRNARNEDFPNLLTVANILKDCSVDLITVHLREDRRHIRDRDVEELKSRDVLPLNLEMAATDEMINICLKTNPFSCCIVPERREELTTEGGLDVKNQLDYLGEFVSEFKNKDIKLSFFVDPEIDQIDAVAKLGVKVIEIHTGKFSINSNIPNIVELNVGHFLISNALLDGLDMTIKKFMKIINHPSI